MGNHFARLRGVLDALILLAILGPAAAALGATASLNSASSWSVLHHPGFPGGSPTSMPGLTISPTSSPPMFYSSTKTFEPSGTTKGKAGLGRTQSSTVAKVVFPAGIGVDQTDPPAAPAQSGSFVQIQFNAIFDITGAGTFGPAVNAGFSIPFGAKIAPGGTAQFDALIEWDKKVGGVTSPARSDYEIFDFIPYTNGSHGTGGLFTNGGATTISLLKTFTSSASLTPDNFIPGGGGNQLIVRGFIQFAADNPSGPVMAGIPRREGVPTDPSDNDPFDVFVPQAGEEFILNMIPESGFEVVPEPMSGGLLLALPALLLRRRPRA